LSIVTTASPLTGSTGAEAFAGNRRVAGGVVGVTALKLRSDNISDQSRVAGSMKPNIIRNRSLLQCSRRWSRRCFLRVDPVARPSERTERNLHVNRLKELQLVSARKFP
jgi:hypothetical protein